MDHHRRVRGRTLASDPRPCEVEGSAGPSVEHMKAAEHRQKMVESLQEDASFCEASFGAYCSSDAHADAFLIDVFLSFCRRCELFAFGSRFVLLLLELFARELFGTRFTFTVVFCFILATSFFNSWRR